MKKNLQSAFVTRQHMISKDFEIYYYNDIHMKNVAQHAHDYYEFYFFLEGDVCMELDGQIFPIHNGDILLIPPQISHRLIVNNPNIPYRRFVFWISRQYCETLQAISPDYIYLMEYAQKNRTYLFSNDRITFHSIQYKVLNLIEEIRSNHFAREAQITLNVQDLILYLNRIAYATQTHESEKKEETLSQNLIEYIEEHLEESLSLETLAEAFYVSKYHIAHVFKEQLGMSIHQYITKKRLHRCREAIRSGASITETYQNCGYGDYSSFFRAFKKEYGISPKEYQDMQMPLRAEK